MTIWQSLSTASIQDTTERIAWLERHAPEMSPSERRYALIDVAMRIAWLAARSDTPGARALVAMLHVRFQQLEAST